MAATLLTQQAAADPGTGYTLVGQVKTALANAILGDQGTVTLTVSAEGVWAYQFTDTQKQALAQLIAGETKEEAQQTLAAQPGVAQASIALSSGVGQTLPTNPAKIEIVVLGVSGA